MYLLTLAMDITIFDFILKQIYTMVMFSTFFHSKTRDEIQIGVVFCKIIFYISKNFLFFLFLHELADICLYRKVVEKLPLPER